MVDRVLENRYIEEKEETFDTSDGVEVNKARKKAARTRADRLKFVAAAMEHPEGRAWFYDLLNFCKIFQGPYDPDPYRSYFLMGEQNIGLRVLADLQDAAPDRYLTMISECKTNKNG